MTAPNYLDAALGIARRGFAVFPLWEMGYNESQDANLCVCDKGKDCTRPAKHPRIAKWRESATRDEKQIRAWWRRWPTANIGLVVGVRDDGCVWALDVDGDEGRAQLAAIEAERGALPPTLTVRSGGGGEHRIFVSESVVGNAAVASCIHVRGEGGYLVAPPSLHESLRRYTWANEAPIAPLDRDTLPFVADAKKQKSREGEAHGLLGTTTEGGTDKAHDINQDAGGVKSAPAAHNTSRPARPPKGTGSTSGKRDLPPNPQPSRRSDDEWAACVLFARRAFEVGVEEVMGAAEGGRRTTLNSVAYRLGRFVGAGALTRFEVESVLRAASNGAQNPLPSSEREATLAAALDDGARNPHPFDGVGQRAGKTRASREGKEGCGEEGESPREREPGEDDDKEGPAWMASLPPLPTPTTAAAPKTQTLADRAAKVRSRREVVLDGDDEEKLITILPLIEEINNKRPEIFMCGREVKRIVRDRQQRVAQTVEPVHLKILLQAHYSFQKVTYNKDGEEQYRPTNLPPSLAEHLLHQPELDFPPLEEVVRQPFVSSNGEIITREGYDPQMQAWLDLGGLSLPPIPKNPTQAEIGAALRFFFVTFLGDFPFADDASRVGALALALLPFVRQIVDGPTPMHVITAPAAGSGKSKLVAAISLGTTGQAPTSLAPVDNDDEWRKRITSTLGTLPTFTLIDNLSPRHVTDSPSLAKALTDNLWTDRILGGSDNATYKVRTAWAVTANNPKLSKELVRRLVWILLDPKMEDPSTRTGFQHANLEAWALEHRAEITHALLTMISAWIAKGRPSGSATLGSYESWAAVMSGILGCLKIDGEKDALDAHFMANRAKLKATLDGESDEIRSFVGSWWAKHGRGVVGAKELYDLCKIKDLLLEAMGTGNDASQKIKLGKLLQYQIARVYEIEVEVEDAKKKTPNEDAKKTTITVTIEAAGYNTQTNTKLYKLTSTVPD